MNPLKSLSVLKQRSNRFDLSHDVKLSLDMGELVPIMCTEVLPGDSFNISGEALVRFAPMTAPVMHRYNSTIHYFFVPNRLVWPNWEKFIKGEINPATQLPYAFPQVGTYAGGDFYTKLMDYFGIPRADQNPSAAPADERFSAIPFAAYQMIYNEYYRDQNLIDPVPYTLVDGYHDDNFRMLPLRRRAWHHDYFTSALPFPQAGDAVTIPVGDVTLKDDWSQHGSPYFQADDGSNAASGNIHLIDPGAGGDGSIQDDNSNAIAYDPDGTLSVDAGTINDLRTANALQVWLERMNRGGRRLKEVIWNQFGVHTKDSRLQRPEYITGVRNNIVISEVLNTTGTAQAPQGDMSGHALGVMNGKFGNYYATEHGYIIGILNIQPVTAYQQGIPKHFLKTIDPTQFYWPAFANLGEQPILNKEIYAFTESGNETFGYVPRYSEYRFENSRVAGDFRHQLNFWHHGIIYEGQPALNESFVTCNPDKRIFSVDSTENSLWCHVYNRVSARRLMPKFANPGWLV